MTGTAVSFDGFDLQTENIITNDIDHHGAPKKSMQLYALGHNNRSALPYQSSPTKSIPVTGTLVADTIEDLDNLIDTFKSYFNGKDKNLDIGYAGTTRRYICTPTAPDIQRPGGLTHASYSMTFECTQPFGQDTLRTTLLSATGRTGSVYADSLDFGGNAPVQWPLITITYTATSGATNKSVRIANNANSQQLTINNTFVAGDILQIDVMNQKVLLNGSEIDFSGAFTEFQFGPQSIGYSDDFTTRTFDIDISQYRMWS